MAVGEAHVFPGFLTPVLSQLSLQSHRLLFSHASADVRGKNTPERKFASTGYRTHNQQVMSSKHLVTEPPGGPVVWKRDMCGRDTAEKSQFISNSSSQSVSQSVCKQACQSASQSVSQSVSQSASQSTS